MVETVTVVVSTGGEAPPSQAAQHSSPTPRLPSRLWPSLLHAEHTDSYWAGRLPTRRPGKCGLSPTSAPATPRSTPSTPMCASKPTSGPGPSTGTRLLLPTDLWCRTLAALADHGSSRRNASLPTSAGPVPFGKTNARGSPGTRQRLAGPYRRSFLGELVSSLVNSWILPPAEYRRSLDASNATRSSAACGRTA